MGLLNKSNAANTDSAKPEFETMDDAPAASDTAAATPAVAASPAPTPAAAPAVTDVQAKSTTVSTPAPAAASVGAVTTVTPASLVPVSRTSGNTVLSELKDAIPVDYNTLSQITVQQGNFMERENKTNMGDKITFDLLSWQDAFVLSPEDDDAPKEIVKYSNDGITTTEGVPVAEALAHMQNTGYPEAKLKQRTVLVVGIKSAAKTEKFNGTMMQIDLPPSSRTMWERYRANMMYSLRIGKVTVEDLSNMVATTETTSKGNNTYTQATFNCAKLAA